MGEANGQVLPRGTMDQMAEQKATNREREMIAAYRAGEKVTAIEARFGVGRSTLYHVLRRAGVTPSRSSRAVDAASGDARLAGLAELIQHQDRIIDELQAANKRLELECSRLRKRLDSVDGHAAPRKRTAS